VPVKKKFKALIGMVRYALGRSIVEKSKVRRVFVEISCKHVGSCDSSYNEMPTKKKSDENFKLTSKIEA
jgi:hypothetical protein